MCFSVRSGTACLSCAPKRNGRCLNQTLSLSSSQPVCAAEIVRGLLVETTPRRCPGTRTRPPGRAGDFRSLSLCSSCPPLFMEDSRNELGVVHGHLNSSPMLAAAAEPEPVLTVSASHLTAAAVCAGGCDHVSNSVCQRLADEELEENVDVRAMREKVVPAASETIVGARVKCCKCNAAGRCANCCCARNGMKCVNWTRGGKSRCKNGGNLPLCCLMKLVV